MSFISCTPAIEYSCWETQSIKEYLLFRLKKSPFKIANLEVQRADTAPPTVPVLHGSKLCQLSKMASAWNVCSFSMNCTQLQYQLYAAFHISAWINNNLKLSEVMPKALVQLIPANFPISYRKSFIWYLSIRAYWEQHCTSVKKSLFSTSYLVFFFKF